MNTTTPRVLTVFILASLALLSLPQLSNACQVPVFRYALEHWDPDLLEIVVLHQAELTPDQRELISKIEAASEDAIEPVNLRLSLIDTTAEIPAGSVQAYVIDKWGQGELPRLLAFFAARPGEPPQLAWSASLDSPSVEQLLSSPTRTEIATRLLDGHSAVWVLLKSGDEAADKRAEETLRQELAKQPDQIQLPSLTDLEAEQKFDPTLNVELRVEFSLLSIEADDSSEQCLKSMLLRTEPDLEELLVQQKKPVAIPIYGRGRTYFALVGEGITAENIADNCHFICGACSCEIKAQNPGQDLLLAASWHQVEPGNWVNDTPLPALTGIGQLEELADDNVADEPAVTEVAAAADSTTQEATVEVATTETETSASLTELDPASDEAPPPTSTVLSRMLVGWGAVLLCVGLAVTIWLRRRET